MKHWAKTIGLQLLYGLSVFVILNAVLGVLFFAFGWAHVDAVDGVSLGLYAGALGDLAARYNPLWNLLEATEAIALLIMPIILTLGWKKLRLWPLPWSIILALGVLLTWLQSSHYMPDFDSEASSNFGPVFLPLQLILGGSMCISYAFESWRRRHTKTGEL